METDKTKDEITDSEQENQEENESEHEIETPDELPEYYSDRDMAEREEYFRNNPPLSGK